MILYFMKQSALEYLKANLPQKYAGYFSYDGSEWIEQEFDYDPFEVFQEVSDFELASLEQKEGLIDFKNCKILYEKLMFLTDSQASDERLWAGLCNKTFYPYMRKRCELARRHLKESTKDEDYIRSRFFFRSAGRSGIFRNPLARCWWTGRLTYDPKNEVNHWELLDAIGPEDLISKISDIFYSNNYSSNSEIVRGFCYGLKFFRDRGIHIANREHIRPTAQYLNAIGGSILLDQLTAEEVQKLVVERIGMLRNVDPSELGYYASGDEDELEVEEEKNGLAEEVNIDFDTYLDSLERAVEIDPDAVLGKLTTVEYTCNILVRKRNSGDTFVVTIPTANQELNPMQKYFLGKPVGSVYKYGVNELELQDIYRLK